MERAKQHQKQKAVDEAERSPSPAIAVVAVKTPDGVVTEEGDDPSPSSAAAGGKKVFSRLGPKLKVSDRLGSPVGQIETKEGGESRDGTGAKFYKTRSQRLKNMFLSYDFDTFFCFFF